MVSTKRSYNGYEERLMSPVSNCDDELLIFYNFLNRTSQLSTIIPHKPLAFFDNPNQIYIVFDFDGSFMERDYPNNNNLRDGDDGWRGHLLFWKKRGQYTAFRYFLRRKKWEGQGWHFQKIENKGITPR